ncbi:MAG: chloride channel protein, partial [Pseudomonadota bacterium]|nr:chloride channel protein [Pseudomonadota bacterium]
MSNINLSDKLYAAKQDNTDVKSEYSHIKPIHLLEIIVLSSFVCTMIVMMMNVVDYTNDHLFYIFEKNHYIFLFVILFVSIIRSIMFHSTFFKGMFGDGATNTIRFFHNTYDLNRTKKAIKAELMKKPSILNGFKRIFTTILTIGAGGSGGLEGPAIPIGESFGRGFAKYFKVNSVERFRIFQMCGIAAAISTLLHAPLTGCIFACELVFAGHFIYQFLIFGMIASLTSFILSNHVLNTHGLLLINVSHAQTYSMFEYLYIVLASCFVSIPSGIGLIFVLKWIRKILSYMSSYLHAPFGALMCYIIALYLFNTFHIPPDSILGVGEEFFQDVYNHTLNSDLNIWYVLALIAIVKIILTSFTIISGGSAGMLIPSIIVGATSTASLYGFLVLYHVIPESESIYSIFIISGIASSLICVMDLPIATIIFITESFGRPYLPIAIVSVIISKYLSSK